jgi:ribokinase
MASGKPRVAILGVFAADVSFRAPRLPRMGETLLASDFKVGPGGKGSNQAVAAARSGADVTFISRIGRDTFGSLALETWRREGITPRVTEAADQPTGSAFIFIEETSGENAIIIAPGAAGMIGPADIDAAADAIRSSAVFVTQLEQPLEAAYRALEIAREAGVVTILNPAPAMPLDSAIYEFCDYVTPNEAEAALLSGVPVGNLDQARSAAKVLLDKGVGAALITLGSMGALLHTKGTSKLIPAFCAGPVVETTGAGDAFNGGFAAALARGAEPIEAARFGCAVAGLSVTRAGTAASMPTFAEVEALLARA